MSATVTNSPKQLEYDGKGISPLSCLESTLQPQPVLGSDLIHFGDNSQSNVKTQVFMTIDIPTAGKPNQCNIQHASINDEKDQYEAHGSCGQVQLQQNDFSLYEDDLKFLHFHSTQMNTNYLKLIRFRKDRDKSQLY